MEEEATERLARAITELCRVDEPTQDQVKEMARAAVAGFCAMITHLDRIATALEKRP